jgi:hypothetical protein
VRRLGAAGVWGSHTSRSHTILNQHAWRPDTFQPTSRENLLICRASPLAAFCPSRVGPDYPRRDCGTRAQVLKTMYAQSSCAHSA